MFLYKVMKYYPLKCVYLRPGRLVRIHFLFFSPNDISTNVFHKLEFFVFPSCYTYNIVV